MRLRASTARLRSSDFAGSSGERKTEAATMLPSLIIWPGIFDPRSHVQEPETVGPDHVHHEYDENGAGDEREFQVALLAAQVHEEHDGKGGLNQGNGQHADQQLRTFGMLISQYY